MDITRYHAKYFACELTNRKSSADLDKLTASLQDAQVDLNPHQVDAALFAFKSPLSKGAILADEVGLGKTIEAGIVLSQQWAERKRQLLIIVPSNLRKQWNQELSDKFFLPSIILETKSFNQYIKEGNLNPFIQKDEIVICSYQFASKKAAYIEKVEWDLVIIDEAHRLRNVYKPSSKIANAIKNVLQERRKILLTATPLQNSILELYGLVSIIDDYSFGDIKSFKAKYSHQIDQQHYEELRERLQPMCQRTLRRQVLEYVNFTERKAIVEEFFPSKEEQQLYDWVSDYLQQPKLYALPVSQRQLMTLIMRKLLASSTYAIHGTLVSLISRLEKLISENHLEKDLESDFEALPEIEDEWIEEEEEQDEETGVAKADKKQPLSTEDLEGIREEIAELKRFRDLASVIKKNTKAEKLFTALNKGFEKLLQLGANKRAIIFTESRRTQEFIYHLLSASKSPYTGKVMLFNGTNTDPESKKIFKDWLKKHAGTDRISGSATADKKAALVDYFRDEATIMIATEAAAEGINLQFCSLVVNYDLPWNPQRIEQRIGRCHRYGQKFDVVVINFLNKANAADQRVYELLDEKFKLFGGVFGASDEVLGTIGSGVDFEKRIAKIYNECRDTKSIQQAFDLLQQELQANISERMENARKKLLENVDEEVREKLRYNKIYCKEYLSRFEQNLWDVTQFYLKQDAIFNNEGYSFTLKNNPFDGEKINPGPYIILRSSNGEKRTGVSIPDDTNIYRVGHPLARRVLQACIQIPTPVKKIVFDYTHTPTNISALKNFVGKKGWLQLSLLSISSFEEEDRLITANFTEDDEMIDAETSTRFFSLSAEEGDGLYIPQEVQSAFTDINQQEQEKVLEEIGLRNRNFFDEEIDKLDQWAEDMKISLQKEIEDLDAEIKLLKAEARKMIVLEEKVAAQRKVKDLDKKRSEKRRSLFVAQDEIDKKKDGVLDSIEQRLKQHIEIKNLFTIQWEMR
ncbi:MAG: DEAD/DEAH box helicase [Chitinophagaceae bacterium]|nr:MAG: DEAD/DEAH box helicase [Chitinophagaceae bacterium]